MVPDFDQFDGEPLILFLPWVAPGLDPEDDLAVLSRVFPGFMADAFNMNNSVFAAFAPLLEYGEDGEPKAWAIPEEAPDPAELEQEGFEFTHLVIGELSANDRGRPVFDLRVLKAGAEFPIAEEEWEWRRINLLNLFRESADMIAEAVGVEIDRGVFDHPGTRKPEAFRHYLLAMDQVAGHLETFGRETSFAPFVAALEADENFEDAANLLADMIIDYAEDAALPIEQATQAVDYLIEQGIDFPSLWIARGRCHRALGDMHQALSHYRRGLAMAEVQRHRALCYFEIGVLEIELGHAEAALEWFEKAADVPELRGRALIACGYAYEKLERVDEAIETFEEALRLMPESIDAVEKLARIYWQQGDLEKAEDYYKQGMAMDETTGTYWLEVVRFYRALDRLNDAEDVLQELLEAPLEDVSKASIYRNLGNNCLLQGDDDGAREFFGMALDAGPSSDEEAWLRREMIPLDHPEWMEEYRRLVDEFFDGAPQDVIPALRTLVERAPHFIEAWYLLGVAYRNLQDDEQAYETYTHVNKIFPGTIWALQHLPEVCIRLGRMDEAVRYAQEALRSDPESGEAWLNLARVSLANGEADAARAACERAEALDVDPESLEEIRSQLEG
jgi:tetratricopeptide (TPR) repeat protein